MVASGSELDNLAATTTFCKSVAVSMSRPPIEAPRGRVLTLQAVFRKHPPNTPVGTTLPAHMGPRLTVHARRRRALGTQSHDATAPRGNLPPWPGHHLPGLLGGDPRPTLRPGAVNPIHRRDAHLPPPLPHQRRQPSALRHRGLLAGVRPPPARPPLGVAAVGASRRGLVRRLGALVSQARSATAADRPAVFAAQSTFAGVAQAVAAPVVAASGVRAYHGWSAARADEAAGASGL